MDSTSIWDIYSSAKKLLPLYERMQNRSVRQESQSIQVLRKNVDSSMLDSMIFNNDGLNNNDPTPDFNMNFMNNEDILSVDLLTPLSASPAAMVSASNKHSKSNGNNENANNGNHKNSNNASTANNTISHSNNTGINSNSGNSNSNNMITPTSITESPNSINIIGIKPTNNNNNDKIFDPFKSYSFSDIVDFKNDEDLTSSEVDFDILRELKRINDSNSLNFQPNQTIRPLDIKIKSDSSISLNNQNILSTNDVNKTMQDIDPNEKTNGDKIITNESFEKSQNNIADLQPNSNQSSTNRNPHDTDKHAASNTYNNSNNNVNLNVNTSTNSDSKADTVSSKGRSTLINNNKPKFQKVEPTSDSSSPSSRPILGSTPQPNELQTQARQSKSAISSSAPTKENVKSISKCNNCGTTKTPLWRKDPNGNTLCNACGLFLKLHGTMRPLSLKTDVIKKRNSKRQSLSAQGEGYKNISHMPPNQKLSSQSSKSYFPQSFPNSNINNFGVAGQNHPQSPHQLQYIQPQPGLPKSQSKQFVPIHSQSQIPVNLASQPQIRSKTVPILPKPSKDASSPNAQNSNNSINFNFSIGASPSQPQDIPQFKRRKSRLNLSSSQNSQPPSPLTNLNTGTSYSPSSSVAYSPITNMTASSPAHANSPAAVSFISRSVSRHNSISSNSSHNLYQDLNNKRGLTYNNANQLGNGTPTNGVMSSSYNNNIGGNVSNGNSNSQSGMGSSNLSVNKFSQQLQQKPSNYSNLSAGMNAIRISSTGKSGLSKCLANVNDKSPSNQKSSRVNPKTNANANANPNIFEGSTNNHSEANINMDDLDWLKFDI